MSTILAAIDATAPARPVLETGVVLGRRLRLPVIGFHLCQDDVEPVRPLAAWAAVELLLAVGVPAQAIVGALGGADVAMVVLGVRGHPAGPRPAGSTALAVADHAIKPVVVGATGTARSTPAGLHRVLVPLDGTRTRPGPWTRPCAGSPAGASGS
jgi:hypothetical protein